MLPERLPGRRAGHGGVARTGVGAAPAAGALAFAFTLTTCFAVDLTKMESLCLHDHACMHIAISMALRLLLSMFTQCDEQCCTVTCCKVS